MNELTACILRQSRGSESVLFGDYSYAQIITAFFPTKVRVNRSPQAKPVEKILTIIVVVCAVLWLGGGVLRSALGYSMFIPGSLKELVPMSDVERLRMIRVFSDLGGYVWLSYLALIPTVLALLIVRRHGLRWRGWEFMSYSLFFLALPFEIFQVRYDWRLYELFHFYSTSPSVSPVVNLFQERFIRTAGFSTGTLFAYFTVILLLVWRPLNNRQTNHE